ncbi:MAG: YqeG family HAD IIIA-type phosphatase, partial [Alphaproteobacteria bacterium]|nr:YqeG family HAD IIIA-type phosphatase [Alphaproteobacteria bacterium]
MSNLSLPELLQPNLVATGTLAE